MEKIRYAIAGSAGRMGRTLIEAVQQDAGASLAAAFEHGSSSFLQRRRRIGRRPPQARITPISMPRWRFPIA